MRERRAAASIFSWGRIISFSSPLITAAVCEPFGLAVRIVLAAVSFAVAAAIWRSLPEPIGPRAPA